VLELVLALCLGPEPEQSDEAQRDAWEAAGWGSEEAPPEDAPGETPAGEGEADEAAPGEGEEGQVSEAQQSAWEAAGWGEPGEGEASPVEGPAPAETDELDASAEASTDEGEDALDPDTDKLKVGDVLAGSLRLTGSFLHFDDEPLIFPNGDDALVLTVGRVLVEADAGEHVHISFNGFGELARAPFGSGLGGSFASAGSTSSAYRTRYLGWQFWDQGAVSGQLGVDRLALRLSFDSVNVDLGRFPITYAVTGMFTTNDFFAPFSATAVNRLYKPGVDALRVSAGITATSSIDVIGALGYDPDSDRPSWGRSAVFTRAAIVGAGVEWAALGGKVAQRWVAGGSIQGGFGHFDLRAEFHVGFPDEEGDGHDADDRPIYGRVAGGPSLTFAWHNSVVSAEYMFASDGASSPAGYIARAQAGYSDDLPYLGQHYVGAVAGMEIIPILRIALTGIVSASDGSGLAGVSLQYNVANESDLILGVFVPWGAGVRSIDPMAGVLELGSEFGLAPVSAYLEARVFF
jgi:hypothetical protein